MTKLEQLELVEVSYNDAKVTLTFLDPEAGEIREVNYNQKSYDKESGKFVADDAKRAKTEEQLIEQFGFGFDHMEEAIGVRKDVYCYEKFNSLTESTVRDIAKFEIDDVGQIYSGEIVEIAVEDEGIRIFIEVDGKVYRNNMGFTKQIAGKYYLDPQKKVKQYAKFEEKFQVPVHESVALIGKTVMFEVKKMATGAGAIFTDVKPFPKKKK